MKDISYGVREFQAHLGQALRAVQRGDRVVITSHGRPIAVMGKVEPGRKNVSTVERKLQKLAAEGKLILGKRRGQRIAPFKVPNLPGLVRDFLADRR
jgi:antitoxin (DNA-binding transcriptional repressor) of toxin-antitoxin stability system